MTRFRHLNRRSNLITEPTVEPVSLQNFYDHLRLDAAGSPLSHVDDDLLELYGKAARLIVEKATGRALINQTWELWCSDFPDDDVFKLPKAPLVSVTSVKYYDENGTLQTLSSSRYRVHAFTGDAAGPGQIERDDDYSWPSVDSRRWPVIVRFVAGYGATADNVPAPLRQAVLLLASHWYENRVPVSVGNTVVTLPMTVDLLLDPFIVDRIQ